MPRPSLFALPLPQFSGKFSISKNAKFVARPRAREVDMSGESKKEEFRKYLEWSGVIDAFTKVLVALYEEPRTISAATQREQACVDVLNLLQCGL